MSRSPRLRRETVEVRGETFIVREWTPAERAAALKLRETEPHLFSASVAAACTIKEDGSRVFATDKGAQDEPADLVDALCAAALRVSGLDLESGAKND